MLLMLFVFSSIRVNRVSSSGHGLRGVGVRGWGRGEGRECRGFP